MVKALLPCRKALRPAGTAARRIVGTVPKIVAKLAAGANRALLL